MQRYSHSIPIFCQILGARFKVPASKSMVAPRAMNTFTSGILSRYFIIHFSCLGAPTPTSSTFAPLSFTIRTNSSHSSSCFSKPKEGECAPTTICRPTFSLIRSIALAAIPSLAPSKKILQSTSFYDTYNKR